MDHMRLVYKGAAPYGGGWAWKAPEGFTILDMCLKKR